MIKRLQISCCSLLTVLVLTFPSMIAKAQTDRTVVSSGGLYTQNESLGLVNTIGQPLIGHLQSVEMNLHQGFWFANWKRVSTTLYEEIVPGEGSDITLQAVPNPFAGSTEILLYLPRQEHVTIALYNVLGVPVRKLLDQQLHAGNLRLDLQASDLPSGQYTVRLKAENEEQFLRLFLLH